MRKLDSKEDIRAHEVWVSEVEGMKIRKGDRVMIMRGKHKGEVGKVLQVIPKKNRVIVEGINKVKRHVRSLQTDGPKQPTIVEREAPIHVSNVMIICPSCNKPTRVAIKRIQENGRKLRLRICKKCNSEIKWN